MLSFLHMTCCSYYSEKMPRYLSPQSWVLFVGSRSLQGSLEMFCQVQIPLCYQLQSHWEAKINTHFNIVGVPSLLPPFISHNVTFSQGKGETDTPTVMALYTPCHSKCGDLIKNNTITSKWASWCDASKTRQVFTQVLPCTVIFQRLFEAGKQFGTTSILRQRSMGKANSKLYS